MPQTPRQQPQPQQQPPPLQLQAEPLLFGFARQPPTAADPLETWLNDGAAPLVERVELGPLSMIARR